ncbi:Selenoprotein M [Cricetulus griseus]|uniref:Selenoprotein M n=1 Tax=Cricetulus griseus TaxID=10029 RepID=G3I208_CRIGR|nr:Selenoprotein M [Cricetulus griseus]
MSILVWPPPLLLLLEALVAPAPAATTYRPDWNRLRGLARGRVERIPLSEMTRDEINMLVQELGFYRKSAPDAQVPPKHLWAPAKPPEDASEHADL